MNEFIIEYELEKISNIYTRKYLSEVISSYNNGNYRAAIVGLHSVVLFDLLHKIKYLSDVYGEVTASEILKDIQQIRDKNMYSSDWENELIHRITEHIPKTKQKHKEDKCYLSFFDSYNYSKYKRLKTDRNLCAHPAHDNDHLLRDFNRDEARVHIRNMFEIVFLKDAVLGTSYIDRLDNDIEEYGVNYNEISTKKEKDNIIRVFTKKYIILMTVPDKKKVMSHLWEVLIAEGYQKNVHLVTDLMKALIHSDKKELIGHFKTNHNFHQYKYKHEDLDYRLGNEIIMLDNPLALRTSFSRVIYIFIEFPELYKCLPIHIQEEIKHKCLSNSDYYILAYFLNADITDHYNEAEEVRCSLIRKEIITMNNYRVDVLIETFHLAKSNNNLNEYKKFLFDNVISANSFDRCTEIAKELIPVMLEEISKDECIRLLEIMNSNSQFYCMGSTYGNKYPKLRAFLPPIKELIERKFKKHINCLDYVNLEFLD